MIAKSEIVFGLPLKNGKFVACQVIAFEKRTMHCISCALFDHIIDNPNDCALALDIKKIFSTVLVFHIKLEKKIWPVLDIASVKIPKKMWPFEKQLKNRGIGAKVLDEEALEMFANAFYGLGDWDEPCRDGYFDQFLLSPEKKPANLSYGKK